MTESTLAGVNLTPEQMAALFAQFKAQEASQKEADKAKREADKKAREARLSALSPHAQPFADAVFLAVEESETASSKKAREEAAAAKKPLPEQRFTRAYTVHVTIDGEQYTLFGYLSKSRKGTKA